MRPSAAAALALAGLAWASYRPTDDRTVMTHLTTCPACEASETWCRAASMIAGAAARRNLDETRGTR